MAIKKSFGGASIRKPGAYSVSKVSQDAGSPLQANDTVLIIGEADAGPGGSEEGVQIYSISALSRLIAKYRSGPIVDAAKNMASPSRTPGVSGAGRIAVYKTNASTQAELELADTFGTLKALEYGVGGNRIAAKIELSSEEQPEIEGADAVADATLLNTQTLVLAVNGVSQSVTFATPADMDDVVDQINAQTTGLVASHTLGVLKLVVDVRANAHRAGTGQSLEILGGSGLANLELTAGTIAVAGAEAQATITLEQPRDQRTESATVGGEILLALGRDDSDSCTAATVAVSSTQVTLTATGSDSYTLAIADYPLLRNLRDAIEGLAGWSVQVPSTALNTPTANLDKVSAVGAFSPAGNRPARIKADAKAVETLLADSSLVALEMDATKGLPDALARTNLAGGTKGASASSSFDAGMAAALAQEVNVIVPLISQDAAQDILDGDTDAGSTYDVEAVMAALDAHLRLRGSIKNRKEAQGMVGYRKAAKADVFAQAASMGSELIQLVMQDVLVLDASGELKWKKPHVLACMMAAMRTGTEVGEPLTHKYLAIQGAGHFVNASTGKVQGDCDPLVDFDEIIDAGVTALEPAAGSFRVMVDNTTYGADANFVFNRGSVVEAAQYVAKTVRADAESAFVGKKTAIVDAGAIKSRVRAKLRELFRARILTASDDAPEGFREDTFIVSVTGNTAEVEVEIKPVQGMDFVFITFTLGESSQSA